MKQKRIINETQERPQLSAAGREDASHCHALSPPPPPAFAFQKNVTSGTGAQETKLSVFCIVLAANGSEPLSALPEKSAMKQASIGRVRDVRGGRTGGGRQFEGWNITFTVAKGAHLKKKSKLRNSVLPFEQKPVITSKSTVYVNIHCIKKKR